MAFLFRLGFARSAVYLVVYTLIAVGQVAAATELPPDPAVEPQGLLRLSDARALALARSPMLRALSSRAKAATEHTRQAGLLPNPELSFEVENFAGSGAFNGFNAAETTLALGQPVQLGGKRGKRRDVASLGEEEIRLEYRAAELSLLQQVNGSFAALLAAQKRLSIAEDLLRLANDTLESVAAQVRAGGVLHTEEIRAQVNVDSALLNRERLRSALTITRIRLAASWGNAQPTFREAHGDLGEIDPPPPLASLFENLDNTPEIARRNTQASRLRAQVKVEESKAYPDILVAAGVRRLSRSDDYAAVASFTVPLPLFDRNQGNAAAAAHLLRAAQQQALAHRRQTESAIATTHQTLANAYLSATRLRTVLIPNAREAFDGTQRSLRSGRLRYTDVLDAQRTLISLELDYVDAVAAYHIALANLEQLTARSLTPESGPTPETPQ